jgi:hypothetical protein
MVQASSSVSSRFPVDRAGDPVVIATLGLLLALLLFSLPRAKVVRAAEPALADVVPELARDSGPAIVPAPAQAPAPARAGELPLLVRVRGPVGEPVPDASVLAFGPDPLQPARLARALGGGGFELQLSHEPRWILTAVASGWCSAEPLELGADALQRGSPVELCLRPFAALRGHLRDGQGRPLAGLSFELSEQVAGEDPASPRGRARRYGDVPAGGRTAADGSFAVAGLARGAVYRMELLPGPWNSRRCLAFEGLEPRSEPVELVCDPASDANPR